MTRRPELELGQVDRQLVDLLLQRIQILKDSPDPQADSLEGLPENCLVEDCLVPEDLSEPVRVWLRHAASISRRATMSREPVVYLGPIYSYSYLAAVKHFGLGADFVPVANIAAAFDEVARGQAAFGVVPIENNTDGRIVDTLGMFAKSPSQICGEVLLPIHHCLLGRCLRGEVTEVQSKPQALSQCREWLAAHLPHADLVEVSSTALAAQAAAPTAGVAAIASREAGVHSGCEIIEENIEDNQHNVTRFAIIGSKASRPTGKDKTSLMLQLKHEPGALAHAMAVFENAAVNLTWIESFPLPNRPNEYLFFVELEGHINDAAIAQAIEELRNKAQRLDLLGSYARDSLA